MKNNDKIKKGIVENILVTLVVTLYIIYIRAYFPLFIIFIPMPFAILGIRNGIINNIVSMFSTFLISGMLLGVLEGITLMLVFMPVSIILNYFIKKREKASRIIIFSAIALFISILVITLLGNKTMETSVAKESEQFITQIIKKQTEMFKDMGMTDYQIFENIDIIESVYEHVLIILPSLYIIISLFLSYLNYMLTTRILIRMGYGIVNPPRFSRFKLPNNIIVGTGFMILTAMIMGKLGIAYHNALLLNISSLVGFVFFIQGLSILDYFLIKIKIKLIFRFIILFICTVSIYVSGILFFLGIMDEVFDIRKIGRRKPL